jgi:hypothetical protein
MESAVTGRLRFQSWTNTDLVIRVPVTFDPGAGVSSLAGAIIDARARNAAGRETVGEVVATDDTTLVVTFEEAAFVPGTHECQVWARIGQRSVMLCVFDVDVKPGFRPPDTA